MKKYLIQISVILVMLVIAWGLFSLGKNENENENKKEGLEALPVEASVRLPVSPEVFPIRKWSIEEPEITAKSAIVINFRSSGNQEGNILYQKEISEILPIASLTKIMTAIIVLENFDLEEVIKISQNSILILGDKGKLIRGEELKVKDLLYIMLIESSNDAANALARDNSKLSYEEFLNLMNKKAEQLMLKNTTFFDSVGLDSKNKSAVLDLANLGYYALNFPFLWDVLKTSETTVYSIDNKFVHNLVNTNELLNKISFLKGGKTGYTEEANGCMLTVSTISGSLGENYLISVVLGSNQRELDTENLINWSKQAYIW